MSNRTIAAAPKKISITPRIIMLFMTVTYHPAPQYFL